MQLPFGDAEGLGKRKQTRREVFLGEMEQVMPRSPHSSGTNVPASACLSTAMI